MLATNPQLKRGQRDSKGRSRGSTTRCPRLPGQTEDPFGDDVALDLRCSPENRAGTGEKEGRLGRAGGIVMQWRPGAHPHADNGCGTGRSGENLATGPEDIDAEVGESLMELGPVQLRQRLQSGE